MTISPDEIIERFGGWACESRSVDAALLFGSRARSQMSVSSSDAFSDIDFQVVTRGTSFFALRSWNSILGNPEIVACVCRPASGGVSKATALLASGIEIDVVVVPALRMRLARVALLLNFHRRLSIVSRSLEELSTVMGGGYRFLKGKESWGAFYSKVVSEVRGARLSDVDIWNLAEAFVCDVYSIHQKILRGELIAAQRMVFRSLLETNFQLEHELRIRRALPSFRDARRLEVLLDASNREMLTIEANLSPESLRRATKKCAVVMRILVHDLVGSKWQWPQGMDPLVGW